MQKQNRHYLTLILAICLIGSWTMMPVLTQAAEHQVTLKCATSDQKVIFKQESFEVYDVGKYTQDPAIVESKQAEQLWSLVKENQDQPVNKITTNDAGEAYVHLDNGNYLICGYSVKDEQSKTYSPVPFLLNLDNSYQTELESYIKYTEEGATREPVLEKTENVKKQTTGIHHSKAKFVKTGDNATTKPYLLLMCASAMVAVAAIVERRARNEE